MSVMMTWPSAMIPPPPIPWIARPASSSLKLCERQQSKVPIVKKANEIR